MKKKKKRRSAAGRKPYADSSKVRSQLFVVRLTEGELALLQQRARAEGVAVSRYARRLLVGGNGRSVAAPRR